MDAPERLYEKRAQLLLLLVVVVVVVVVQKKFRLVERGMVDAQRRRLLGVGVGVVLAVV